MTWPMCVVDGVLTCLCRTTPLFSPYLALTCGSDSNWFSSTPAAAAHWIFISRGAPTQKDMV